MLRLLLLSCCLVSACSVLSRHEQLEIEFLKISKIEIPVITVSPSYKHKDEIRMFLEVSFVSNLDVISFSIEENMNLRVTIGLCNDFFHIPGLANPDVYFDGKTMLHYFNTRDVPTTNRLNKITYQTYINYSEYEKLIQNNVDTELCLQVTGASYTSSFKSNKVKIPISELKSKLKG